MSKREKTVRKVSRRDTLKVCLVPAGALAARWLAACGDTPGMEREELPVTTDSGPAANLKDAATQPALDASQQSTPAADAATTQPQVEAGGSTPQPASDGSTAGAADAGADTSVSVSSDASVVADGGAVAGPGVPWASGGTKSIQGTYPDPFAAGAGMACVLYPKQTLGPCYSQMPPTRQDVSAGIDGLPVRLSFLVVRANGCTPVPNATIDIWHSGSSGIYSAFRTGTICNPGTTDVLSENFCRGVQSVGSAGRVDFNTVFPGWYTGRSIHIHFTVRVGSTAAVTSQLYFEDALTEEILAQGIYKARGKRDTTNQSDSTFRSGGATPAQVLFTTAKRPDGVLHAWKVLSIA
jgi:protocatechuate 3,4-dioxygenase beta subunit